MKLFQLIPVWLSFRFIGQIRRGFYDSHSTPRLVVIIDVKVHRAAVRSWFTMLKIICFAAYGY